MRRIAIAALVLTALPLRAGGAPAPALAIAHRGGSAYAPENTMTAYLHAVDLGADALETDTQLTADGVLVLIHDDDLERTTDCSGTLISKTYAEVASCDAGYWYVPGIGASRGHSSYPLRGAGIAVPRADELFAFVASLPAADRPSIDIEIKDIPGEANFDALGTQVAGPLVDLIHAYPGLDVTVQSFWPPALEAVKLADPSIRTHFLTTSSTGQTAYQNLIWTVARGHQVSSPNFTAPDYSADYVALAHAAGKEVWPYTANSASDIGTVLGSGADGVISDWPACVLQAQGRTIGVPASELWLGATNGTACPG